jgi:hypothetical protein
MLAVASFLALGAGGVLIDRQVTRLEHDLDAATTQLRPLRGEQARAEQRISGLTSDLDDLRTTVNRNAAKELDTAESSPGSRTRCSPSPPTRPKGRRLACS